MFKEKRQNTKLYAQQNFHSAVNDNYSMFSKFCIEDLRSQKYVIFCLYWFLLLSA